MMWQPSRRETPPVVSRRGDLIFGYLDDRRGGTRGNTIAPWRAQVKPDVRRPVSTVRDGKQT
jgi:hypothetical protein